MKRRGASPTRQQVLRGGAAAALAAAAVRRAGGAATAPAERPSFLFILADDLGYGDLGAFGQTDYQTPHLDGLARQGTRLTQAYANSAVCSATRFALITGRYQYRLRGGLEEPITRPSDVLGLPPGHPTLPSLLRRAGYATALFGKWHLGFLPKFGPLKSGYDVFFGNYGGAIDYFTHRSGVGSKAPPDLYEGEVAVDKIGYYTGLVTDRAVSYLGERARERRKPFFLSLHYTAPHWPWEGPGDQQISRGLTDLFHYDGGNQAIYGRMVGALDASVGRVLAALDEADLARDTFVVFTSDNGGERFSRTWPLSGQKTELLEGGIRVPTIVRWPGRIPAGKVSTQAAISMDWLPTFLAAARTSPDPAYPPDGANLLEVLTGKAPERSRILFWRYKANGQEAVRSGPWKYLKIAGNEFLFDVMEDPRERANLARRQPEIFADLKGRYAVWNRQMLPITGDVVSGTPSGEKQADRYQRPP
jgi:arylsulfatase A-like enzyme